MRSPEKYVALGPIKRPGTMVNGYQRGDDVSADVVDAWELVVGDQVMPVDTSVVARPTEDGTRAEWQAYAIGRGMDPGDAQAASLDDLVGAYPDDEVEAEPLPVPGSTPARPEPDALKADWVAYVLAMGADRNWAEAKGTTKADLQDWDPSTGPGFVTPVGDPLAVQATELANG